MRVAARDGLVALAILVGGAAAASAAYTFGWHDSAARTITVTTTAKRDPYVKTVKDPSGTYRVYTLRYGDIVRRPQAATRCRAEGEGGSPNLFCDRIGSGRHEIIFYRDSVLVWPLDCPACGPDGPVYSYKWGPKGKGK
jgi:hypothetical protein